jgi:hypothetical protein
MYQYIDFVVGITFCCWKQSLKSSKRKHSNCSNRIMSGSINGSSAGSGNRVEPYVLSYGEVTTFSSGGIISKQMKLDLRKQYGYCITCPLVPVQIVDIRRAKMNPLWISKKPRTKEGECLEGRCLKCFPERDTTPGKTRPSIVANPSFHSRSTQSFASSISSCSVGSFGSQNVETVGSDQAYNQRGVAKTVSLGSQVSCQHPRTVSRESSALPPRPIRTNSEDSASHRFGAMRRTPLRREDAESMRETVESTDGFRLFSSTESRDLASETTCQDISKKVSSDQVYVEKNDSSFLPPGASTNEEKLASEVGETIPLFVSDSSQLLKIEAMLSDLKKLNCDSIFIECLLSAMDSNCFEERILMHCLSIITKDLLDGAMNCTSFIEMRGTTRIFDALRNFSGSPVIQDVGCEILVTLSTIESEQINLIHQGVCESLCQILGAQTSEARIVDKTFEALRILSTVYEARKRMIDLDLAQSVVQAMQNNSSVSSIQLDGCAILSNLSVDVQNNTVSIVDRSELKVIVEAMQLHSSDESVMASGCFALKNCTYNVANLRSMNKIPNMIQALEKAALFCSLTISAEQTIENLYLSLAEEESMNDHTQIDCGF